MDCGISSGVLVTLKELHQGSPHFKQGASLRVVGKLLSCNLETAIVVIGEGDARIKVDTSHLEIIFRLGSLYQFIGELHIEPNDEATLTARVGRIVDGMDINLYHQSLELLRGFLVDARIP